MSKQTFKVVLSVLLLFLVFISVNGIFPETDSLPAGDSLLPISTTQPAELTQPGIVGGIPSRT